MVLPSRVDPLEEIPHGPTPSMGDPPPPTMLLSIMEQMAALTKGFQIAQTIVGGVMVKMGRSQHNPSLP